MHFFETKLSAIGRALDGLVERMRFRSPRRYRPRSGPTFGERWREARERWRDGLRANRWFRIREWDGDQRRRVIRAAVALGVVLLIGAGVWLWRVQGQRPSLEELMAQAAVRARMDLGRSAVDTSPFKGWGESPRRR